MQFHHLLLISCLAFVASAVQLNDDSDSSAAEIWKNILRSGDIGSLLSERDLKFIMENAPPGAFDQFQQQPSPRLQLGGGETITTPGPIFPELTPKQRKFAVNPGFRSYADSKFRKSEGISEDDAAVNREEIASDPFSDKEDKHQSPKKAAMYRDGGSSTSRDAAAVNQARIDDIYFTTIVAVSSALSVFAIVGAGFCYHRVRRNSKASEEVEYPAYGVTGPGKETSPTAGTDRKLAQNAQMYHYQHQKQQMIAFDSATGGVSSPSSAGGPKGVAQGASLSDCESDDDGEEGDYTVYECPGLAPAGEMEVRNPLFQDDPTPKASK